MSALMSTCGGVVSRHAGRATLAVLVLAVVLAPRGDAATVNASVTIGESGYSPATVTIRPGERVIWFNGGTRDHTVTSDSGTQINSGAIAPGEELSVSFERPGTYSYHSAFLRDHMRGTVVVAGEPDAAVATVTVTTAAIPPSLRIATLDRLRAATATITDPSAVVFLPVERQRTETWWSAGLIAAAGVTTAAVVLALLAFGRRRPAGDTA